MYEKVWFQVNSKAFIVRYPFPPTFYGRRAQIIKTLFNKEVICIEFQAEPWCPQHVLADCSLEEQRKTMSLEQFQKNIEFAKKTGLKEFYLLGRRMVVLDESKTKPARNLERSEETILTTLIIVELSA